MTTWQVGNVEIDVDDEAAAQQRRSFATLRKLLAHHDVGVLATAVETCGVHGIDRFGRNRRFERNSPEAGEALAALAEEHVIQRAVAEHGLDADWAMGESLALLDAWGWPGDQLPDLGEPTPQPVARAAAQTKSDNTLLRLIVALAAEHGIDITRDKAAQQLERFLEQRGDKPPSLNALKGIVERARLVADKCEIVTERLRRGR